MSGAGSPGGGGPGRGPSDGLLVEGAACVRHGDDVLSLLARLPGVPAPVRERVPSAAGQERRPGPVSLDPATAAVRQVLGPQPVDLATVVRDAGLPLGTVALALEALADLGLAESDAGWWRRVAPLRGSR